MHAGEDGAEDLLGVPRHLRRAVVQDRRPDVPVRVPLYVDVAAVERDRCALRLALGDERLDARLGLRGDHGRNVGVAVDAGPDLELLGLGDDVRDPLLGLAHEDAYGDRHAALARRAERGRGHGGDDRVLVGVGHDARMVFGAEVGLHALAVVRPAVVDVLAGLVAADKRNGLDVLRVSDTFDGVVGAVDDVEGAVREACLLGVRIMAAPGSFSEGLRRKV